MALTTKNGLLSLIQSAHGVGVWPLSPNEHEDKMAEIAVVLNRAPDEPKDPRDRKFQDELNEFSKSLRSAGLKVSQRGMAFDTAEFLGYASYQR